MGPTVAQTQRLDLRWAQPAARAGLRATLLLAVWLARSDALPSVAVNGAPVAWQAPHPAREQWVVLRGSLSLLALSSGSNAVAVGLLGPCTRIGWLALTDPPVVMPPVVFVPG